METNHYVYAHLKDDTIRYVGVGRNNKNSSNYSRAYNFNESIRTRPWLDLFETDPPEVIILEENLSYNDSIYLENYIFHSCKQNLVNITEPRPSKDMDFDLFDEWFYIDKTSPSGLRLKKKHKNNKTTQIGDVVGTKVKSSTGKYYWRVKVGPTAYFAHRVVFLLAHGHIDNELVINHIDGNGLNNSICNLEQTTHSMNSYKKLIRSDNKTSHNGLSFTKYKGVIDGVLSKFRKKSKRFSIIAFGSIEQALQAALRWKKYQEHINNVYNCEDFNSLELEVLRDTMKSNSIRRKPTPVQAKSGTWYVKFKYKNTDENYVCLSGYDSRESIESEVLRLVNEYNSKASVSI